MLLQSRLKAYCTQISPRPSLFLMRSKYSQINWDTSGSPEKRLVNPSEAFKKAPPDTPLHLPADRVNSPDPTLTCQPTGNSSSGQPLRRRTGRALLPRARVELARRPSPELVTVRPLAGRLVRHYNGCALLVFGFKIGDLCWPLAASARVFQLLCFACCFLFNQTIRKYGFREVEILSAVGL